MVLNKKKITLYKFFFFLFTAILTGIIYPIQMGWQWGGGWLAAIGFSDFAGSTLVHSCGGAAALAGVILLGPRNMAMVEVASEMLSQEHNMESVFKIP